MAREKERFFWAPLGADQARSQKGTPPGIWKARQRSYKTSRGKPGLIYYCHKDICMASHRVVKLQHMNCQV